MTAVVLGPVGPGSVAATTFVLVERGAARRPDLAARLPPTTRIVFAEGYPAVRIARTEPDRDRDGIAQLAPERAAGPRHGAIPVPDGPAIVVGDDDLADPAVPSLQITAPLPALLAQLTVPLAAGMPSPLKPAGRAVLRAVATGEVAVDGRMTDGLRLLRLLSVLD